MKYGISQDARPQARTLLFAAALSIVLWFVPFAEVLSYPFRVFVTFIHEGGHAIAALLTGNSVQSLSIAMNASGETYTTQGGTFCGVELRGVFWRRSTQAVSGVASPGFVLIDGGNVWLNASCA